MDRLHQAVSKTQLKISLICFCFVNMAPAQDESQGNTLLFNLTRLEEKVIIKENHSFRKLHFYLYGLNSFWIDL